MKKTTKTKKTETTTGKKKKLVLERQTLRTQVTGGVMPSSMSCRSLAGDIFDDE